MNAAVASPSIKQSREELKWQSSEGRAVVKDAATVGRDKWRLILHPERCTPIVR